MLGERWSLLIIREIFSERHRFTEIQSALGVASNLLTTRLKKLVDAGVLRKQTYQEPGIRNRIRYHLTPAGEELLIVLAALPVGGAPLPTSIRTERSAALNAHHVEIREGPSSRVHAAWSF
ncbi:helix-turn-helix domain-containing protein [Streptomyces sp. NPDC001093]|uniref:winged helix-turn-helix transcriptional regulator n=1 Tax=Streptomyces sp. NPDC001093 TaxID=3154376 RepID=UPI003326FB6B